MFQMLQPAGFGQVALGIALEGHPTGWSKAAISAAAREAIVTRSKKAGLATGRSQRREAADVLRRT